MRGRLIEMAKFYTAYANTLSPTLALTYNFVRHRHFRCNVSISCAFCRSLCSKLDRSMVWQFFISLMARCCDISKSLMVGVYEGVIYGVISENHKIVVDERQ